MCGTTFLTHAKKAQPSRVGSRTARSRPVGGEIRMRTQHKSPTGRFLSWGYISFGNISCQSCPMLRLQELQGRHQDSVTASRLVRSDLRAWHRTWTDYVLTGYPDVIPPLQVRPELMTVCIILPSLVPILRETGVGADVMKPIAAPIVGGIITGNPNVVLHFYDSACLTLDTFPQKNFPFNNFRTSDLHLHPKHSVASRMLYPNSLIY